jgi:hypothetical protein
VVDAVPEIFRALISVLSLDLVQSGEIYSEVVLNLLPRVCISQGSFFQKGKAVTSPHSALIFYFTFDSLCSNVC